MRPRRYPSFLVAFVRPRPCWSLAFASLSLLVGCPTPGDVVDGGEAVDEPDPVGTPLPAYEQRPGDVEDGYAALVNNSYVGCGLPDSAYSIGFPDAPAALRLEGREGRNTTLPYNQSAFVDDNGVTAISANCLFCHAAPLPGPGAEAGAIVIGLGDANLDFTVSNTQAAELAGLLITDPLERQAWEKWKDRVVATSPYTITKTIGVNPANNLAGILFAHRDPETLAWSDTPLLDPPSTDPTPTDVPPWWLMRKKNVMFYNGAGRGDHARMQMTASTLCIDSVDEAMAIDEFFDDIRAYIASLEPPAFPGELDEALVAEGTTVFEARCSQCHGTYGEGGEYPNLFIPIEEVGTDELQAGNSEHLNDRFVDWFNNSFYGELATMEPGAGYVAPPLDGIWATAPYLHNGSIPTLATLLDSSLRPMFFERSFSPSAYDLDEVGWPFTELEEGHGAYTAEQRRRVYDTTQAGYGNGGHTYGDALSIEEREAVIEYLKSL